MKFPYLIEYNAKNNAENEVGRLVPDLLLFFKNTLYGVKASVQQFRFNICGGPWLGHILETNCIKFQTVDPEIFSILIF